MKIQKDNDEKAFGFYKCFYGEKSIEIVKDQYKYKEILVNGDVIFNFKLKRPGNKFTLLASTLEENYKKEYYKKKINDLYTQLDKLRYSPMNISICPKTGGLNNIKQSIGYDRLDTFAWLLDQYYNGVTAPIINAGALNMYIGQRRDLEAFLKKIGSVSGYFEEMYGINDKNYVRELIKKGKQAITNQDQLFDYIEIALEFWKKRMENEKIKKYLDQDVASKKEWAKTITDIDKKINELRQHNN